MLLDFQWCVSKTEQCHADDRQTWCQALQEVHISMMEGDPQCSSHPPASLLQHNADYLGSHRGREQLVKEYVEVPEAGKGWQEKAEVKVHHAMTLLLRSTGKPVSSAWYKWQYILVVGSILGFFKNILGISLLCWTGEEEVLEPLNAVYLALFLLTCERVKARFERKSGAGWVFCTC